MKRKSLLCIMLTLLLGVASLPSIPNSVQAAEDGLLLWMKFDGNLEDQSGNLLHGECPYGDITYEKGIFGDCGVFNGKSYIEVPDTDLLDLKNSFTISLWAYKEDMKDDYVPFVYKEEDQEVWESPYKLYQHSRNTPGIFLHQDYGEELDQFFEDGSPIDIRKWFLLTVTFDGDEVKLYHNEQLMRKVSVSGTLAATVGNLYIGMLNDLEKSVYFKGKMDDLRIYNKALTAKEIEAYYKLGLESNPQFLTQTDDMVAYYKFESDYKDSAGYLNDAKKVTGEGSVKFVDAIAGKGLKFTKGSYLEVRDNDSINFDRGFSVSGWICAAKDNLTLPVLHRVGASNGTNSNDYAYGFDAFEESCEFRYAIFTDYYATEVSSGSLGSNMKNKWYHIAVTFDGNEIHWYKNGKEVGNEELDDIQIAHASGKLMIGSDGEHFFEGMLDELRLYNYALNSDEVKQDYDWKDSLSISQDNQGKIKALKAKDTVTLATSRTYVDTKKTAVLKSGITYKSSSTKVFTVSKDGKLTAVKKGTATLYITHGGITKSYKVTVK